MVALRLISFDRTVSRLPQSLRCSRGIHQSTQAQPNASVRLTFPTPKHHPSFADDSTVQQLHSKVQYGHAALSGFINFSTHGASTESSSDPAVRGPGPQSPTQTGSLKTYESTAATHLALT